MSREPPDVDPVAADGGRPPDSDTADGDATGDPTPGPAGEVPTVSRDVRLGEADAADFTAADTAPVADASVASLLATLDGGDAPARRRAALALAERDLPRRALDALAVAGSDDADSEVRQFAVEALGEAGGDRAAVREALADPDPWVRAEAVVALDHLDREAAADAVERALDDDHPAVRRNALISLVRVRGEAMRPALLDALSDPSDRVREWAAKLLGEVDGDDVRTALAEAAAADESDVVRDAAARALDGDGDAPAGSFDEVASAADGLDVLNRPPDR
jgi:HEAT repeat protein